ncbi:MazG nucleotide pyrophosphohydrolase domain-containing protein [Curtobacterium sp. 9128]|uniref:MazG nucleotide pyrophosphohydrolase domain-containing protein n=1 Tax=Curtobacterium sp. 9128 TaxID=1793722 RepID=UPI00164240F1|nr:MazG nucleotide pyrophosphohydrolase domain-containing protein [Curtobacterium sp. 9128]
MRATAEDLLRSGGPLVLTLRRAGEPRFLPQKEAAALLLAMSRREDEGLDLLADVQARQDAISVYSDLAWDRDVVVAAQDDEARACEMLDHDGAGDDQPTSVALHLRGASASRTQAAIDAVYGRLELDRALTWTMEELGEYAQAARRGESPQRLAEELGQLAAWVYCLGNITGVDVESALQAAVRAEVRRQRTAYGELRPYGAVR